MQVQSLAVVGSGTMGGGIAQVAAVAGLPVTLVDTRPEALERALSHISHGLSKWVEKGRIDEPARVAALGRVTPAADLGAAAGADVVIEAVFERFEVKREVLQDLDRRCGQETILASNTSSLSITRLAAATRRPANVIGMHFMNPVPLMQLVEIVRGLDTSEKTFDTVRDLADRFGKVPVEVNDAPGFVANRVLLPMINEAAFALMEGVASREAIDTVMRLGLNHPLGPLALADLIGLDVCLDILDVLYEGYRDSKYRPCPLLRRLVEAGRLGRKSGRGFYEY